MLYLVRHARPCINPSLAAGQWPLSSQGIVQAEQLAVHLAGKAIQLIVSSTELKAVQTAQILADRLHIPVEVTEGLHEHERSMPRDFIASPDTFKAQVQRFFSTPGQLVFGNETADQTYLRFDNALQAVLIRNPNRILTVVTHGTVLSLFLCRHCGVTAYRFWLKLGMPASVTVTLPSYEIIENWSPPDNSTI